MIDLTLLKDLTESIAKSLTFNDIEMIGKYFFKDYNTHKLENVPDSMTISTQTAARRLITQCQERNRIEDFFVFMIETDGTPLNGKTVKLAGLENILYRLSKTGMFFDFNKRKIVSYNTEKTILQNWGALKEGKEYPIIIASIDICQNSELVKKYKPSIMEKVYYRFSNYLTHKLGVYNGRVWSWAGDGGLLAFRDEKGPEYAVSCCLEILLSLPAFNKNSLMPIEDDIKIRIGMDMGDIKFYNDTGRIVSDVINFAAHLEKNGTKTNGLSISEKIYSEIDSRLQKIFKNQQTFENRKTYSLEYNFECIL